MLLNRSSNAAKNRNNFSKMMSSMGRRNPASGLGGARHLHQQDASLGDHHQLVISAAGRPSATAASSAPHLVQHSARLRTLATTVFIRGVATRSGKDAMGAKPQQNEETQKLGEFRNEMTMLIDKEVKESCTALNPADEYLAELNYKLTVSDGVATLKRTQGRQIIEVSFAVEEDDDEEEGGESKAESEEEEQEEEDDGVVNVKEFQAQDINSILGVPDLYISTEVKITIVDDTNKEVSSMSLSCSAFDSRFFIDTLYSVDGKNEVNFEQFSEGLQVKIYDYMETLKLDSRLGTFIFEFVRNYHTHKSAQVLHDLKHFMSHLRDV